MYFGTSVTFVVSIFSNKQQMESIFLSNTCHLSYRAVSLNRIKPKAEITGICEASTSVGVADGECSQCAIRENNNDD